VKIKIATSPKRLNGWNIPGSQYRLIAHPLQMNNMEQIVKQTNTVFAFSFSLIWISIRFFKLNFAIALMMIKVKEMATISIADPMKTNIVH
jgi:hypothetical protein